MRSRFWSAAIQRIKGAMIPGIIASVAFSAVVSAILFAFIFFGGRSAVSANAGLSAEGKDYLRSLEQQDPAKVDDVLRERRRLAQERGALEETVRKIESDEVNIWSLYQDSVILGDSRCEAFSFYNFLQQNHVLAETGSSIYMAYEHLPQIRAMQPAYVYLCYGINDMAAASWKTGEEYAAKMGDCIARIHEASPDSLIVISSILPVTEPVLKRHPEFGKVGSFNDSLKKLCAETPYAVFSDNDALVEAHKDLYASDGIHVNAGFYAYWAKNMFISVLRNQISEKTLEAKSVTIGHDG